MIYFSKITLIFTFSFLWPPKGMASSDLRWIASVQGNCFTAHLHEAVKVNQARKKVYSALTAKKTQTLSNGLIILDRLGTLIAPSFDSRSQLILGPNRVPLLCEVIPSILPVLDRPLILKNQINLTEFVPFSASRANKLVHRAFRKGGLELALVELKHQEKILVTNKRFNCLARQFIQSMIRLAEVTIKVSTQESERLARDVLNMTLLQMRILVQLDREAAPFQAAGIPILCAENPSLPQL
jgi:hypothetical protein